MRIETIVYWAGFPIREFSNDELDKYSYDWQRVLSHPNVGILDPSVVGTEGVLIAEQPIRRRAASIYGAVAYATGSYGNPDLTDFWRMLPLEPSTDLEKLQLKEFKQRFGLVIAELIVPTWFPEMHGVPNAVNIWPIRLAGTFITVPTRSL